MTLQFYARGARFERADENECSGPRIFHPGAPTKHPRLGKDDAFASKMTIFGEIWPSLDFDFLSF